MPPDTDLSKPASKPPAAGFEPDLTQRFQARMPAAPAWVSSMLAGNSREKTRLRLKVE